MSDTPKTDNGIREVLESIAEMAAIYGDNQQRTNAHIRTAEKFINAIRHADMDAVIGKSKPQYQWGDGTAKSLWYEAQHKLQEEQRKRMKERLNG